MKNRYSLFKRGSGSYYAHENATNRQESLHTKDKAEAHRLLNAKNQAANGSSLNFALGSAYLTGGGAEFTERKWAAVMEDYCKRGNPSYPRAPWVQLSTTFGDSYSKANCGQCQWGAFGVGIIFMLNEGMEGGLGLAGQAAQILDFQKFQKDVLVVNCERTGITD